MEIKKLLHDEIKSKGRRLIVSTVEIWPGKFETLVMYACNYADIDGRRANNEADARRNHAELIRKYKDAPKDKPMEKPLTGKYLKLAEDLKRVHTEAVEACKNLDDNGTCNCDAPALLLPHWNARMIEQAAKYAGVGCFAWKLYGSKHYVFCPRIAGQAYRREKCAEYMTDALKNAGYDAITYCQMD